MDKVIITVVGKDTVGIIAKVCTYLADHKINILDISQTIVQEYFNMMMIVTEAAQAFHSMKWLPVSMRSALESASTSSASVKRSLQKCTVFD